MEVRDPIHGGIDLSPGEMALIQQPFVHRLRDIRQVGFSTVPFPCASHSRYAHVLGVMHVAGMAFDRAYEGWSFDRPDARARFRATVRLAAMSHDLGHPPFSHCTEFAMPLLRELGITWYHGADAGQRATHEDYTIAILERSGVGAFIDKNFPCTSRHVAALISHEVRCGDDFFRDGGLDHRRLLSQIISSELDADRLDYLVRDAYFSGARYGMVDVNWILSCMGAHTADGQVGLALDSQGLYAFEDFLVARHHMFLMVYFHHKSVVYEEMMKRWVQARDGWTLPADLDAYLRLDDVALTWALRQSDDPWARRIVQHDPYRRVVEKHGPAPQVRVEREAAKLEAAGFETIVTESSSRLSRYHLAGRVLGAHPIYVTERLPGQPRGTVRPLAEASHVFQRYAEAHCIARIYVAPEQRAAAWQVLGVPAL